MLIAGALVLPALPSPRARADRSAAAAAGARGLVAARSRVAAPARRSRSPPTFKPALLGLLPVIVGARPLALGGGDARVVRRRGRRDGAGLAGRALMREYVAEVLPRAALYGEGGTERDAATRAAAADRRTRTARRRSSKATLQDCAPPFDGPASASLPRCWRPNAPHWATSVLPYLLAIAGLAWAARRLSRGRDDPTIRTARRRRRRAPAARAPPLLACVVTSPTGWVMGFVWALPIVPLVVRPSAARARCRGRPSGCWAPPGSRARCPPLLSGWAAVAGTALVVAARPARPPRRSRGRMIWLAASVALLAVIARAMDRLRETPGESRATKATRMLLWAVAAVVVVEAASAPSACSTREATLLRAAPRSRRRRPRCWRAGTRGSAATPRAAVARRRRPARRADRGLRAPRCWAGLHRTTFLYDTLSYHLHVPATWMHDGRIGIVPAVFGDPSPAYAPAQPRAGVPVPDGAAALGLSRRRRTAAVRGAGRRRDRRDRARGGRPPRRRARRRAGVPADSRGLGPGADRDDRSRARGAARWRRCRSPSACGAPAARGAADLLVFGAAIGLARRHASTPAAALALPFVVARLRSRRCGAGGHRAARRRARARGRCSRRAASGTSATPPSPAIRSTRSPRGPGCRLPALYGGAEMRAWDYHVPVGDVAMLGACLGGGIASRRARAFGFAALGAPSRLARRVAHAWRTRGRPARRAAGDLLVRDPLPGEPLPVRRVRRRRHRPGARRRPGRPRWWAGAALAHRDRRRADRVADARAPAPGPGRRRRRACALPDAPAPPRAAARDEHSRAPRPSRASAVAVGALAIGAAAYARRDPGYTVGDDDGRRLGVVPRATSATRASPTRATTSLPARGPSSSRTASPTSTSRARPAIACTTSARPATAPRRAGALPPRRQPRAPGWRTCAPRAPRSCSSRRCTRSCAATIDSRQRRLPRRARLGRRAPRVFHLRYASAARARLRGGRCDDVGRRARRPPRALSSALLLFVAGRCLVPMDETDLFFNLRLGEIVLHDHAVPRTNLLSFTYPDAPRRQPGLAVPDRPRARPPRGRHPRHAVAEDGVRPRARSPSSSAWRSGAGAHRRPPRRRRSRSPPGRRSRASSSARTW